MVCVRTQQRSPCACHTHTPCACHAHSHMNCAHGAQGPLSLSARSTCLGLSLVCPSSRAHFHVRRRTLEGRSSKGSCPLHAPPPENASAVGRVAAVALQTHHSSCAPSRCVEATGRSKKSLKTEWRLCSSVRAPPIDTRTRTTLARLDSHTPALLVQCLTFERA